jgi:hypothetical protein
MEEFDFDEFAEYKTSSKNDNTKAKNYLRMHETKDGRVRPLFTLDDTHLENTIKSFIRYAVETKKRATYKATETIDIFSAEINGIKPLSQQEAVSRVSSAMYKLEPYLTELVIRNKLKFIEEISPILADLIARKNIQYSIVTEEPNELTS